MSDPIKVTIDGTEVETASGEMLIKSAQDHGTYIPHFCWHERMKPVGMCRMCLVEIETPRGPMLVTSCTTPVSDGMIVDTLNPTVKKAQEGILEFLLANHPLDCPVCDKGGECPLQDQAFSHGPGESRFVEIKRHFEKPIPISDLVLLDRERCILCARCTRFSDEISGDPLIEFKNRGNRTEVNTFPDLPFSSYFSGNTVQICPVGALTSKNYRFRARPWDLQMVESCTTFDPAHPRIAMHSSQNEILRVTGIDNDATNQGWLSDKDRYGFEYLTSPERLTAPLVKRGGEFEEVPWSEALDIVANRIGLMRDEDGGGAFGVIGGSQGTNEDAYAISKFARVVLGTNNIDSRVGTALSSHFLAATVDRAEISDLDRASTIVLWGPDLKETNPTLYLRVRRAVQDLGARLVIIHPRANGLDDRAELKLQYRPGGGFKLLDEIADGEHPDLTHLLAGDRVVALVGRASMADDPQLSESAAALFRNRASNFKIMVLGARSNLHGALDMGLAPDLLPGRIGLESSERAGIAEAWGELPTGGGDDTNAILKSLDEGKIRCLFLVGADPVRDLPHATTAFEALEAAEWVVSVDMFVHDSNKHADVIFPATGFAEKTGTITNLEGRVQKINFLVPGPGAARADWEIFADIADRMGHSLNFSSSEAISKEIAAVAPAYAGITWDLLDWEERDGVVVPSDGANQPLHHIPVALKGQAAPGAELTLHVARVMYDDGVRLRHVPSLHQLSSGPVVYLNPEDAKRAGAQDGATVRVIAKAAEGEYLAALDPGTPQGVVYVPFNQSGAVSLGVDPVVRIKTVGK